MSLFSRLKSVIVLLCPFAHNFLVPRTCQSAGHPERRLAFQLSAMANAQETVGLLSERKVAACPGACPSQAHASHTDSTLCSDGDNIVITATEKCISYTSMAGARPLNAADVERSTLLANVAEAQGSTKLACSMAYFQAWLDFSRTGSASDLISRPQYFAPVICTADYLQDCSTVAALVHAAGRALPGCVLEEETQPLPLLQVRSVWNKDASCAKCCWMANLGLLMSCLLHCTSGVCAFEACTHT